MTSFVSVFFIALIAAAGAVAIALFRYQTVGGPIIVGSGMLIVMFFLLPRLAGRFDRKFIRGLTFLALAAKILASAGFIFYFSEIVETGLQDGNRYAARGTEIADLLRDGHISALVTQFGTGTPFLDLLTGVVFTVTGSTIFGGYAIFSMLGLIGSIFFYRAFVVAVPAGNTRLFAVLVMFYPAILFWTSPIGKDAVVFLFGGLATYGLAIALVRGRPLGFLLLALSLVMIFFTRPEIAAVFALAIFAAIVLWTLRGVASGSGGRLLVLGSTSVIAVFGLLALPSALEVESISIETVVDILVVQTENEFDPGGDGSNFAVTPITSPTWIPMAFVTTLIRPFPGELVTSQGLVQSAEGMLLAGLLILNLKSGLLGIAAIRREPYMVFTLVFAVAMILVLSTTANFGLLARLRVILLPALFTMVAYRPMRKMASEAADHESEDRIEEARRVAIAN